MGNNQLKQLMFFIFSTLDYILDTIALYAIAAFCIYQFFYQIYWIAVCRPKFNGKTVLITGASSGMGESMAL